MTKNFKSINMLAGGYASDNDDPNLKMIDLDGTANVPCLTKRFEESDDFNN
jgi:hypothetical protein